MSGPRRWLALALAGVACAALVACGDDDAGDGGDSAQASAEIAPPERIADAGAITFCTSADSPPLTFQEAGKFEGVDPDIAREIAERLGVDADFSLIGFDAFIGAVRSGTCDAFMAGVSNTPERAKQVHLTDYAQEGAQYLVKAEDADLIGSEAELCGLSVAVVIGTTHRDALDEQNETCETGGESAIDVSIFNTDQDAAQALAQDQVDAWVSGVSVLVLSKLVERDPERFVTALPEPVREDRYAIASQKDDSELNAAFAEAVDAMYADGKMDEILKSYGLSDLALD